MGYVAPGGYSKVIEVYRGINVSAPNRVLVVIGEGKNTYFTSEAVIRDSVGKIDDLLHVPDTILKVMNADRTKQYEATTHYVKSATGIDWTPANEVEAQINGFDEVGTVVLDGLTFKVQTNLGSDTITFTATETNIDTAITKINAGATYIIASKDGDVLILKTQITNVGDGAYIKILNGTANDDLGFYQGSIEYGFGEPAVGDNYIVEYEYLKIDSDYVLKEFYGKESWFEEYGYPIYDGQTSRMGVAGEILYNKKVNLKVYGLQTRGGTKYHYQEAIDKLALEEIESIPLIIPLTADKDIAVALKNHCDIMCSYEERKERTGLTGDENSTFNYNTTDYFTLQDATLNLSGEYLAVMLGAIKTTLNDLAVTSTFQKVDGIDEIISFPTKSQIIEIPVTLNSKNMEYVGFFRGKYQELNDVAINGVTIIEERKMGDFYTYEVRHNITTKIYVGAVSPPVYESEPTSVAIRYWLGKSLRETLIVRHGGQKINSALLKSMEITCIVFMDAVIELELLNEYDEDNVNVIQDENNLIKTIATVPGIKSVYNNLIGEVVAIYER